MAEIKASDQLAAMAIIDEMRREKTFVDETLDLETLRAALAQRIRAYYKENNIAVSDEIVEQGVKAYFANRLRFSARELSFRQTIFANAYIHRGAVALVVLAVAVLTLGVVGIVSLARTRPIETARINALQTFNEEIERLMERFRALPIPEDDMKTVTLHAENAKRLQAEGNRKGGAQEKETLEYLLRLAQTPLTLRIIDRKGESSGVEKTYPGAHRGIYYLIAEAIDGSGMHFPLLVSDRNSGISKTVTRFGVRVPDDEFERIKNDKLEDGRISDTTLGEKPLGQISFSYRLNADGNDVITEW